MTKTNGSKNAKPKFDPIETNNKIPLGEFIPTGINSVDSWISAIGRSCMLAASEIRIDYSKEPDDMADNHWTGRISDESLELAIQHASDAARRSLALVERLGTIRARELTYKLQQSE